MRIAVALGLLVIAGLFAASYIGLGRVAQCDGSVPKWMVPDDYDGGGCVELRPFWEGGLPWNIGDWEHYCLGMCLDDV
jgi:hypothetical protein